MYFIYLYFVNYVIYRISLIYNNLKNLLNYILIYIITYSTLCENCGIPTVFF